MGCGPSRPTPTYYDEYFKPPQPTHHRHRSHRIAKVDGCTPGVEYQNYLQQYEQDVVADKYAAAYDQLTAKSKLSKAHGLESYYDDRGWS